MAAVTPLHISFSDWLVEYLNKISNDIDAETYGDYIEGLLKDDSMGRKEIIDSIVHFLESVLVRYCSLC